MFHVRNTLHRVAYQHKCKTAIEAMWVSHKLQQYLLLTEKITVPPQRSVSLLHERFRRFPTICLFAVGRRIFSKTALFLSLEAFAKLILPTDQFAFHFYLVWFYTSCLVSSLKTWPGFSATFICFVSQRNVENKQPSVKHDSQRQLCTLRNPKKLSLDRPRVSECS